MSYYCVLVYRIDKILRRRYGDCFKQSYNLLEGLCENVHFLLNTIIIVISFVLGQHRIFMVYVATGECIILILRKLQFGVFHCCYCLLIYDDYNILSCFILN